MQEQENHEGHTEPGSIEEARALARLDALRDRERATYEEGRQGWDARAGSPSTSGGIEGLWRTT